MFVPAAEIGLPVIATISGRRSVPRTRPSDRVHVVDARGIERVPLGATACCPDDVDPRGRLAAAGKDEALELRKLLVKAVAVLLERLDLALADAQPALLGQRHRQIGAEVEELVLHPQEHVPDAGRALSREHDAEEGVDLVHRPIGRDPLVQLRNAGAVPERRLPRIASARVYLRQPDRLVSLAGHGRRVGR